MLFKYLWRDPLVVERRRKKAKQDESNATQTNKFVVGETTSHARYLLLLYFFFSFLKNNNKCLLVCVFCVSLLVVVFRGRNRLHRRKKGEPHKTAGVCAQDTLEGKTTKAKRRRCGRDCRTSVYAPGGKYTKRGKKAGRGGGGEGVGANDSSQGYTQMCLQVCECVYVCRGGYGPRWSVVALGKRRNKTNKQKENARREMKERKKRGFYIERIKANLN
ncbi:hypothetical protein ABL78_4839 [Leptomonas seymouri]|uniref:Uncharacterized protein n=1 Tax=Leptomonas seymouri TaxID=5684 RepID=A0A0N1PCV5_LEPSE|nr:hypothetical protein ABL78_4839 [Leptomonas seymouri]|eukprot:KPI86112.1 hypothetical protein ABL78_4839 [Leptomonas seymouri]